MLFFLVAFSIPYIRHSVYELFAYSHILAAIVYFGVMLWHTADNLHSVSFFCSIAGSSYPNPQKAPS